MWTSCSTPPSSPSWRGASIARVEFIGSAVLLVDPAADPVTVGLLHERWARYLRTLGQPTDEILDHVDTAVRLVPRTEISARARVLATQGQQLMLSGRSAEAVEPCEQAIELAQAAGELGDRESRAQLTRCRAGGPR